MSASPLARMLEAIRVKSPFSQSAWLGFMARPFAEAQTAAFEHAPDMVLI
jgi:hypothetical protein